MDTVEYVTKCCGIPVTRYVQLYSSGIHGWEEGFRCRKCGRIRIPVAPLPDNGEGYQIEVNALRALLLTAGELDITD